ncbi:MAG: hypothetical protein IPJ06_14015 [Saprospiraceae bacterium]|nr:hypothetical protein [Saprospiraceae bacterium]
MFAMTSCLFTGIHVHRLLQDIWWYGGALGQRAMVRAYPDWLFPLPPFSSQLPADRFSRSHMGA